jgi:hypothetical protein
MTSMTAASAPSALTSLGVATAGETGKTTFGGQPFTSTDALVMYTYTGDANLDGKINADDYFQIDSHINKSAHSAKSWFNGDFNYDGQTNGDDYFLIDNAFAAHGAPFTSAPSLGSVIAVPEPAVGFSLVALPAALAIRRRRRQPRGKLATRRRRKNAAERTRHCIEDASQFHMDGDATLALSSTPSNSYKLCPDRCFILPRSS